MSDIANLVCNIRPDPFLSQHYKTPLSIAERVPDNSTVSFNPAWYVPVKDVYFWAASL